MKRVVSVGFMVMVAFAPVFAGGQGEAGSDGGPLELTFWTSHTPPDSITLAAMVDAYNASQQAVRVEMVQVPGSETDVAQLMTAVRGGTGPDIYMLDRFTVAQRAAAGVLEDLTAVMEAVDPGLPDAYIPYAWQETQFQGRTYALPLDTDARVLYYNRRMIAEAGIDPAILDSSNGPITVAQAREIARAIDRTDGDGNYTQVGFIPYDIQFSQGWHYTWGF
ncbi:MAG: extracellular solute-binding protein, partial [Spirochaetales bacterium]|nr:extracellular solute-binding protein [Spirochaetales bacterium]